MFPEFDYLTYMAPVIRFRVDGQYFELAARDGFGLHKFSPLLKASVDHDKILAELNHWWVSFNKELGESPREAASNIKADPNYKDVLSTRRVDRIIAKPSQIQTDSRVKLRQSPFRR